MFDENAMLSFNTRFYKREKLHENFYLNEIFNYVKPKNELNSDKHNISFEFIERPSNIFNKIEKLKERKKHLNNINNININEKNPIKNIGKNTDKKSEKKSIEQFLDDSTQKRIFSKKKLLEKIFINKKQDLSKEKNKMKFLNPKAIRLSKILSKSNLFINDSTTNEYENNKANFYKPSNEIILDKIKNGNYSNKTNVQEKMEQINMNKTALFKKIKFESLKKFCKNVKLTDKKLGINLVVKKGQDNKSEIRKNNCEEIKINSIKEKVRNYFVGRFNNIKEYFKSWDEQMCGKISIIDMHNYLNNKIKYKISKNDVKKLLFSICNKNYLNYDNFRIFFFEDSPEEKLLIRGNNYSQYKELLTKNINEISHINKSETNNNISLFEKFKFNEILLLLLKEKNDILMQINKDRMDLTFVEFYSIIRNVIKGNKFSFDKELKKLFNDYKEKNSDLINVYNFFEKISEKREKNQKNNYFINIKKNISQEVKPIFKKNKSSFMLLNSRNTNNNFFVKESNQSGSNFLVDKVNHKEFEKNQKRNLINLYKFKNININSSKEKNKFYSSNLKIPYSNSKIQKKFNECVKNDNNDNNGNTLGNIDNSKLIDFQLPKIIKHKRNKSKNSDIINFL